MSAFVMGPSFSISKRDYAFGFHSGFRSIISATGIPYEIIPFSYEGLNDWYSARQMYASIIEKAPQFSRLLYYQIGELYYKEGNYKRAISYFEQFERLQGLPLIQFTVNGEKEEILERETLKKLPITLQAVFFSLGLII